VPIIRFGICSTEGTQAMNIRGSAGVIALRRGKLVGFAAGSKISYGCDYAVEVRISPGPGTGK
jgi:hypothetical protein